jgi:hypothetical protein
MLKLRASVYFSLPKWRSGYELFITIELFHSLMLPTRNDKARTKGAGLFIMVKPFLL